MAAILSNDALGTTHELWNLNDLFSGLKDPAIQSTLTTTVKEAQAFESKYKGTLHTLSPEALAEALVTLEILWTPFYKLSQYMGLLSSEDTSNDEVKALDAKVDEIGSQISNHLLFFDLEIGDFTDAQFAPFDGHPALSNYAYDLQRTRKTASFNLTEPEEKIVNLKDITGKSAHKKLYEELTNSFSFEFELDGKVQTLSGEQLRNLRHHPSVDVRRKAMTLFFSRYEEHKIVITHLFNNIVKDMAVSRELRGYSSAINVRNVGNDLTDKTVQTLHDVTTDSYSLVHRYYNLKKKILDLPDMTLADIYAPMPTTDKTFTYQEAKELVLDGFGSFDNEIYAMAKSMFDEKRIHAPVMPKKRGGAFCSASVPSVKPYVLLNFMGKPRDVATMAHELGHGIHDMLASKQTLTNFHPILPLAETASIFSEMIITDLLLSQETDNEVKKVILIEKIEDILASSHRQNMFSKFEMAAHAHIQDQLASTDDLNKLYTTEIQKMFGESVRFTPEYQWEWSAIPHMFNWPFYVYAYNFGNLLVMALYESYKEQGPSFIPKYKELLSLGSAADPITITKTVGVDITSEAFWQKSVTLIERMINDLEALL